MLLIFPPMGEYVCGAAWSPTESPAPPLGLLYLATPLIKVGYEVAFLDLTIDRIEDHQYFRLLSEQDFILLSCYTRSVCNAHKIIRDVRSVNPHARVLCGGPYCLETGKHFPDADLTVFGEAEHIIVMLLDMLIKKAPLHDIPGISFMKNGRSIRNPGVHVIDDLDSVDPPCLDLAMNKDYGRLYGVRIPGIRSILTSRGCPFHCSFCSFRGLKYRKRSVGNVLDEIQALVEKGARFLVLHDDNFLIDRKRVVEMMDAIIERKFRLKILFQARGEISDRRLCGILKEAGVIIIVFGIESANQDVLDFYRKETTVERLRRSVELADDSGIITFGNFMIGAPMENRTHFENNKRFFKAVPLDFINVHILHYVRGTPLWQEARRRGLIRPDEHVKAADSGLCQFSSNELRDIQSDLLRIFYGDPRRIIRQTRKIVKNFGISYALLFLEAVLKKHFLRPAEKFLNPDWRPLSEGSDGVRSS